MVWIDDLVAGLVPALLDLNLEAGVNRLVYYLLC
jgi:hypothetical protein